MMHTAQYFFLACITVQRTYSLHSLQDDFDDLCETLTDRLGQPSHKSHNHIPRHAALPPLEDKSACSAWTISAVASKEIGVSTDLADIRCGLFSKSSQYDFVSPALAMATVNGASENSQFPTNNSLLAGAEPGAETTELVKLAGELQILADMTCRLRMGLDHLLELKDSRLNVLLSSAVHPCLSQDLAKESGLAGQSININSGMHCGHKVDKRDICMHESLHSSVEMLLRAETALTEAKNRLSCGLDLVFKLTGTGCKQFVTLDGPTSAEIVTNSWLHLRVGSESGAEEVGRREVQERQKDAVGSLSRLGRLQSVDSDEGVLNPPAHISARQTPVTISQKPSSAAMAAVSASALHGDMMVLATGSPFSKSDGMDRMMVSQAEEKQNDASATESIILNADSCMNEDWGRDINACSSLCGLGCIKGNQDRVLSEVGGSACKNFWCSDSICGDARNGAGTHANYVPACATSLAVILAHTSSNKLVANLPVSQFKTMHGSLPSISSTIPDIPSSLPSNCQWMDSMDPRQQGGSEVICCGSCKSSSPHLISSSEDAVWGQVEVAGIQPQAPLSVQHMTLSAGAAESYFSRQTAGVGDLSRYCV